MGDGCGAGFQSLVNNAEKPQVLRGVQINQRRTPSMAHDSGEEHLAELAELVAQAEAMGVDLGPEPKPVRPWAKYALASFMIIMIVSWVSKAMVRFANV